MAKCPPVCRDGTWMQGWHVCRGPCPAAPRPSLFKQRQHFSQTSSLLPARRRGRGQLAQVRGVPGGPPQPPRKGIIINIFVVIVCLAIKHTHPHGETETLRGRPLCSPSAVPPLSPALISGTESLCVVTLPPPPPRCLSVPKGRSTPSCLQISH